MGRFYRRSIFIQIAQNGSMDTIGAWIHAYGLSKYEKQLTQPLLTTFSTNCCWRYVCMAIGENPWTLVTSNFATTHMCS